MAAQNNITTKSYLVKRLKDSGYSIDKMEHLEYTKEDKRKFSILIDNGGTAIVLTCFKDGKFQFYDGGRTHNAHLHIRTDSVEVIYEYLNERGVISKHWSYENRTPIYGIDGKLLQKDKPNNTNE